MGLLLITLFTIQEVLRRRLFLVLFLLSLLLLAGYTFMLHFAIVVPASSSPIGVRRDLLLWACGLIISLPSIWLVYLISGMLTIFLAAGMISAEVEAGTFAIIVPKPLRRAEIVLGKWLGYALLLGLYTAFLFFLFLGIIFWQTGYWPEQACSALLLLELAMLALLGLVTLGSTLASTLVNGAVVMILFLSAPITGMIFGILSILATMQGTSPESATTMQNIMAVINLVIPADALWHGSAFHLVSVDILGFLQSQGMSADFFSLPPLNIAPLSFPLLIWTLLYVTVLPLLAIWRFQKRDLA